MQHTRWTAKAVPQRDKEGLGRVGRMRLIAPAAMGIVADQKVTLHA